MKNRIIYIILCFYLVYTFQPYVPFLDYALHKKYISEQLCINKNQPELHCEGSCYRASQIAKRAHSIIVKTSETPPIDYKPLLPQEIYESNDIDTYTSLYYKTHYRNTYIYTLPLTIYMKHTDNPPERLMAS